MRRDRCARAAAFSYSKYCFFSDFFTELSACSMGPSFGQAATCILAFYLLHVIF